MSTWEIIWRVAAIAVLLSVGVGIFAWMLMDLNNRDDGWNVLEANTANVHCGDDFTLNYFFGKEEGTQAQAIVEVYTAAVEKAYWLFSRDAQTDAYNNIHYINNHVNQPVTVDPVLYEALSALEASGCRNHYLGPVYTEYNNIFFSEDDSVAQQWDPRRNEDAAAYVKEASGYANDPQMIRLDLLGNNTVQLTVAQAYLDYAQANEITEYLDLHWMTNAFIIDYLAESLMDAGYNNFYLTSVDGLVRRVYDEETAFSLNLYDMYEGMLYPAATMRYAVPMSIVSLRDFILLRSDAEFYYAAPDGTVTTSYIDPADGLCRSATDSLVVYSETAGCAETLLQAIKVYIAQDLNVQALEAMAAEGFHSIHYEGTTICPTDSKCAFSSVFIGKELEYSVKK